VKMSDEAIKKRQARAKAVDEMIMSLIKATEAFEGQAIKEYSWLMNYLATETEIKNPSHLLMFMAGYCAGWNTKANERRKR